MAKQKTKKCKSCGERKNVESFKVNRKTKDGYVSICKDCSNTKREENKKTIKHEHFYVYKLLNNEKQVLYVGKTTNINKRINTHIHNHLSLRTPEKFDMYNNVHKIEYCEMESDYHMNIYEIHYICKYNPLYNIDFKSENSNLFNLPEIIWKPYILKSYIDDSNLYYYCSFKLSIKDVNNKLKTDKVFYKEFIKEYLDGTYVHRAFNPDYYAVNNDGEYELIYFEEDNIEEETNS